MRIPAERPAGLGGDPAVPGRGSQFEQGSEAAAGGRVHDHSFGDTGAGYLVEVTERGLVVGLVPTAQCPGDGQPRVVVDNSAHSKRGEIPAGLTVPRFGHEPEHGALQPVVLRMDTIQENVTEGSAEDTGER